jgi:hypothetical protein
MLMAKKKTITRRTKNTNVPNFEGSADWDGEKFSRAKDAAFEYFRLEKKSADFKKYTMDYVKTSDKWKEHATTLAKAPDSKFNSTLGTICVLTTQGMPDVHPKYNEWWHSLLGTMGTPKPHHEYIDKWLKEILEVGEKVVEEKKEEEVKKQETYVPSIQQRIREASTVMVEAFEQTLDDFCDGKITDFKAFKPLSHLRQVQCKQPHARLIASFYEPQIEEYNELLNPPNTAKMSEQEKDYAQQLKEAYSHYDKKQIKKLYDFLVSVLGACDAIIAESKANRKPRKISAKSPEKVVEKLKYKVSDEKYSISSVPAHKMIGATCLVVFNTKNRKLGIYYTSVEDPTGTGRDGSGLNLKGQTLQRYNEEKSVWWTLRKPVDQLQEVKNLNTRKKFENWIEKLTTTPTKMNGRINPETVLIGVY